MDPSSLAGIITAIATVLIALGGLVGAVALLIPILRGTRDNAATLGEVRKNVTEVHVMVNQQRTDMENYIRELKAVMGAAGVPIPRDQSAPPEVTSRA